MYEEETDLLKFVAGPPAYREAMKRSRMPLDKSVAGWVYKQSRSGAIFLTSVMIYASCQTLKTFWVLKHGPSWQYP